MIARVTDYTGAHVTLHIHGLGEPGQRPMLGQLIAAAGDEWYELAGALQKGGIQITDPHGLLTDTPLADALDLEAQEA